VKVSIIVRNLAISKPDNDNIPRTDERVDLGLDATIWPSPFLMGTTSKLRHGDTERVFSRSGGQSVKEISSN
jgi:hypothetical protein